MNRNYSNVDIRWKTTIEYYTVNLKAVTELAATQHF